MRIAAPNLRKDARSLAIAARSGEKLAMSTSPTAANRLGLSASQAARALGVSVSTVRRWSDSGALRGYRTPGGQRRFSREQIDAFLVSLERGTPPDPAASPSP
ncbi:MerR family transcriptional regulator [Capillimicrobium parvum]|uniref:MerR family transcriptional regulator n=1 Tax=Capillimicrobium parvum TaxID=2884022 RepID=UPI00216AE263|nr:helix-turn-helix domain-containing protein [Capillimicrobium parvum]